MGGDQLPAIAPGQALSVLVKGQVLRVPEGKGDRPHALLLEVVGARVRAAFDRSQQVRPRLRFFTYIILCRWRRRRWGRGELECRGQETPSACCTPY